MLLVFPSFFSATSSERRTAFIYYNKVETTRVFLIHGQNTILSATGTLPMNCFLFLDRGKEMCYFNFVNQKAVKYSKGYEKKQYSPYAVQREDGWCKSSGAFWNQSWSCSPEIIVGADGFSRYREQESRILRVF